MEHKVHIKSRNNHLREQKLTLTLSCKPAHWLTEIISSFLDYTRRCSVSNPNISLTPISKNWIRAVCDGENGVLDRFPSQED